MATGDGQGEAEDRQASLAPIAHVLRETYDAENHDTLGRDLTGLMLELARVEPPPLAPPAPAAPPPAGWWRRMFGRG